MRYSPVSAEEFASLEGLSDWRYLLRSIHAHFRTGSFPAAGALVAAIAEAAERADHHPDVDLRYPDRVRVVLSTHATGGVSDVDVDLARTISALAADAGATAEPATPQVLEVGIDTLDPDRIRPFWLAVLGYRDVDGEVVDPLRVGPTFWFQPMDEPRPQRNRLHVDIDVPHDVAADRIRAALDAGGRLVTDEFAPSWWVLADAEGNEACICTWQGR